MSFKDKITVITGGKTGIGRATSELLRDKGSKVYVLDINTENYTSEDIFFVKCDVTNYEQVKEAIKTVFDKEGRIDFLFTSAGVHFSANIEETTIEDFERVLSTNLKGTFYILKAVIPIMKQQKSGSVVLMGSDQSLVGKSNSCVYGLTKAATAQLAKSTAIDYADYNIRVNCVCPGTIETPLYHNAVEYISDKRGLNKEDVYAESETGQPIKRVGTAKEVANAVVFLLSDESGFTTGALLSIDGGYTCQ